MATCQETHPKCKAACCKTFTFTLPKRKRFRPGQLINIGVELTEDLELYYKLHGCKVIGKNQLQVRLREFRWVGNVLIVTRRCDWLTEDLLCKEWGGLQPDVCKAFDMDNQGREVYSTPNCRFKREETT